MPMIGARFYTQLDSGQLRSDVIQNEMGKVIIFTLILLDMIMHYTPPIFIQFPFTEFQSLACVYK